MPTLTNTVKQISFICVFGTFWDCTNTTLSRCAGVPLASVNKLITDTRQMVMMRGLLCAWSITPGQKSLAHKLLKAAAPTLGHV